MKEFKEFTIQILIIDSAQSKSEELVDPISNCKELVNAVIYPKSDPLVATQTSDGNSATDTINGNSPHKLLANREISTIIQGVIPMVHQVTVDGVSTCGGALLVVCTVLLEDIGTGAAPSATHVFKYPPVIKWRVEIRTFPIDMNTVGVSPRDSTKVLTGTGTSTPPISIRSQKIVSPRESIGPEKVRNAHPFKKSINQFSPEHGHLAPIFSKAIGRKIVPD